MRDQSYTVFFQPRGDMLSRGWRLLVGDRPAGNDDCRPFREGWGLPVFDHDDWPTVQLAAVEFLAGWHVRLTGPWTGEREVWHVTGTSVDPATIVVEEEDHGTDPCPAWLDGPGNEELFTDHGLTVEETRVVTEGQDEVGIYLLDGVWYAVLAEVYAHPDAPVERFLRRRVVTWPLPQQ